jgi:hypothetical protein
VKTKDVKAGWSTNLAESSKKGYGSKGAVLQMMMTIKNFYKVHIICAIITKNY